MRTNQTSVLIVGGGLVGLSSALFLALRGVKPVVVEKHPGSSLHPRAIGYTARTMELLRAASLEARIPAVPAGFRLRRVRVESLAGKWFEESSWTPKSKDTEKNEPKPSTSADGGQAPKLLYSPCLGAAVAQDTLEPLLRERAIELGADIRLETELVSFEQDAGGVTALVRGRDGTTDSVRASYLIGADGLRSPVREALGVRRSGRGHMRTVRSVLFRASLEHYLETGISQFEIKQPDLEAFLTTYHDGRWVLMFSDDQERDEATLLELVHKAIGRSDIPIEIITTGRWELSALIAEKFSSERVFLAGDAAHTLPPARGGYGANTGIEDAHNLAWKLDAVLRGESTPALLDTYDAERRPIAWLRHDQIFARPDYRGHATAGAVAVPIIDDDAMELGQIYRSRAVLGAGADLPPALRPDEWRGQPGTRAPHAWVMVKGGRRSTLDLFQRGWVLLAADAHWVAAAKEAAAATGIPLTCLRLEQDVIACDAEPPLGAAFGLGPGGASLVRPDGYVAFRSTDLPEKPAVVLADALRQVSAGSK